VKDDSGITNLDGVFAAGDVVSGPQSVIEAMASGRKVAEAIHRHLRRLPHTEAARPEPLPLLDERIIERIKKSERQTMSALPVGERTGNFREVDLGYSREQAAIEAQRCLNCGAGASVQDGCASCLQCVRICPYGVPQPGKDIAEIDISQCQACGICAAECPASAILLGCEPKEDLRRELDRVMDIARQETPELLIIGFYCRYASPVGPPFDSDEVYWVGRFCTGRVNESHLIYPFEMGADGVIVSICGDDECRFRDGSRQMKEYLLRAKRILRETRVGAERLDAISDEEEFPLFRKKIEALGVNPMRSGKKVEA
jgi:coenzyme F420-reducing hydrogenase delta subunit/NAD-dependent dihydropyrimidine dehydrogenase PreA subunit